MVIILIDYMTAVDRFVEDVKVSDSALFDHLGRQVELHLVNPKSWQAVGKTREWREKTENTFEAEHTCWQAYWTGFYGHLADGLTIEAALNKIE